LLDSDFVKAGHARVSDLAWCLRAVDVNTVDNLKNLFDFGTHGEPVPPL
jgi:hypothetical protein